MKKIIIGTIACIVVAIASIIIYFYAPKDEFVAAPKDGENYKEISFPTPNLTQGKNKVQGVVLHHTATASIKQSLVALTSPKRNVSCHVLIDYDGTRYILAQPEQITHHAGYSTLNGRNHCNAFTIGIEFQGCTTVTPLTEKQIASAVEYLKPIIKKYHIPSKNIVTHEMVRTEWLNNHPNSNVPTKPDVVQRDYKRVLKALDIK